MSFAVIRRSPQLFCSLLVGLLVGCTSGSGGGGGTAGDPPAGQQLNDEQAVIDFAGQARFELTPGGAATPAAFAIDLTSSVPDPLPAYVELLCEPADLRLSAAEAGEATITVRIAADHFADPCGAGDEIGAFSLTNGVGGPALASTRLTLSPAARAEIEDGRFGLCLTVSGDVGGTLEVTRLVLDFGPADPPEPGFEPEVTPEGEDELEITFPESGDTVMSVRDPSTDSSIAYFGTVGSTSDELDITGFELETAGGSIGVRLDAAGHPTEIVTDSLLITTEPRADGAFDYELSMDGELRLRGSGEPLDGAEMEELADVLAEAAGDGVSRAIHDPCAEAAHAGLKVVYNTEGCKRAMPAQFVAGAMRDRGYQNFFNNRITSMGSLFGPHGLHDCPITECVRNDPAVAELVDQICEGFRAYWIIKNAGLTLGDDTPVPYYRFEEALGRLPAAMGFMILYGDGLAADHWDRAECGCREGGLCGADLVCSDDHCVPKCASADDCPPGLDLCVTDGRCIEDPGAGSGGSIYEHTEGADAGFDCETAQDLRALEPDWSIHVRGQGHSETGISESDYFKFIAGQSGHIFVSASGQARANSLYDATCSYLDGSGADPGAVYHEFREEVTSGQTYYVSVYTFPGEYDLWISWHE